MLQSVINLRKKEAQIRDESLRINGCSLLDACSGRQEN
jgi:hypothetical protein